jgi:REP element-mobilizing transposase RayT
MKYNPEINHRKSIRLKGYDYSQDGAYFLTICTRNKELYFEVYSELKEILRRHWVKLPERFPYLILDEFIIMPNHIHGIIIVGATPAVAQTDWAGARPAPTVGEIVGTFKSLCVNDWLTYIKENKINAVGKFWQRNYYEHIIRNEEELAKIREYIQNNPLKWSLDRENPERVGTDVSEDEIFNRLFKGERNNYSSPQL